MLRRFILTFLRIVCFSCILASVHGCEDQTIESYMADLHKHGTSGNFEDTVRYISASETFIVILTNQNNGNISTTADKLESLAR